MRLKQIKLAGFKSFVDPTTVAFPSNLSGIVGPNGCGKSNIIDAVRWVMGESSAKYLRGESIADVIFNGSSQRKPSGQASIELHFDHAEAASGYPELMIRRQVNLEGHSTYYLNGTVCRRRDITDIFLGTGLGPRSYAIIEQGMISRLIDAKPEELRVYLEEAAGISKYKERRRETELRLQHTRDNLTRLNDIREELQKQLDHLGKQAKAAEKYQQLKDQEKTLRAALLTRRIKLLEVEIAVEQEAVSSLEVQWEARTAESRHSSAQHEIKHQQHITAQEALQEVQKSCYEANTAIARLEAQLQHHKSQQQKLAADLASIEQEHAQRLAQQQLEKTTYAELIQAIAQLNPKLAESQTELDTVRTALAALDTDAHHWQEKWDNFNQEASQQLQAAQSEQLKIQHLEKHLSQLDHKIKQLAAEKQHFQQQLDLQPDLNILQQDMDALQTQIQQHQQALAALQEKLQSARQENEKHHQQLDQQRTQVQSLRGRFASLQALQEAALGKNKNSTAKTEWDNHPRLAEKLTVNAGFERAVETALGRYLEGICIDSLPDQFSRLNTLAAQSLLLIDNSVGEKISIATDTLAAQCQGPAAIINLLADIVIADSLEDAVLQLPNLASHGSVMTREGVWLGHGWLSVTQPDAQKGGVIVREKMLAELQLALDTAAQAVDNTQLTLQENQALVKMLEASREEHQKNLSALTAKHADLNAAYKIQAAQLEQHTQRKAQLVAELESLAVQQAQEMQALQAAQQSWSSLMQHVDDNNLQRQQLQQARESQRLKLQIAREAFQQSQQQHHRLSTQLQVLQTQRQGSEALAERLAHELEAIAQKIIALKQQLAEIMPREAEYLENLEQFVASRAALEKQLQTQRSQLAEIEHALRALEKQQKMQDEQRDQLRSLCEEKRLAIQSGAARVSALKEQLQELECTPALEEERELSHYEEELNKTLQRIERLGAVNLAAIAEHTQQSERKLYLDQQNEDLMTALNLLEEAIRKIDQETRARFKEMYEKVNSLFQDLFPRIFSGGQAFLELTGHDLLETGVSVIACPPGKRNSTIHLLSGGEKALTAIALVFSIFQLNPAPFCMLDEVDAPLDDANIGRFCELVKEMSKSIQFIFISHNKLAMEMAEHLIGVTMNEPGVSRLVAVDIHAAMEMAES